MVAWLFPCVNTVQYSNLLLISQNSYFVLNSSLWHFLVILTYYFDIIIYTLYIVTSKSNYRFFAVLFIHSDVNSSHTFIVFLILNIWETVLQTSINFLLNPFFVYRNDLYVNLLYYMYMLIYKNEIYV